MRLTLIPESEMWGSGMGTWWYILNGEREGPTELDDFQRLLVRGVLTSDTLVWQAGMTEWQPIERVPELAGMIGELPPDIPKTLQRGPTWQRIKRHLGSSIAILIACLATIIGLAKPEGSALIGGIVMFLGAFAYRSAKARRLGEVKSTLIRKSLEWCSVFLILPIILMQKNLGYLIADDPIPNAVIPVWAIVAYFAINFMPRGFARQGRRS